MRHCNDSGADVGGTIIAWIVGLIAVWVLIGLLPDILILEANMIIHYFTGVRDAI